MKNTLGIGWFLTFTVVPLGAGLLYALFYSLGLAGILGTGFTLEYWGKVLGEGSLWQSLGFSLYIATMAMTFSIFLAMFLVVSLRESFRKGLLSYVIYFPLAIPAMVAAFISFQLLGKAGFLSRLSHWLGLTENIQAFPDWVNDTYGIGIIFSHVLMAFPFLLLLFISTYESERLDALKELAQSLGAGRWESIRRLQVPVILWRNLPSLVLYYIFVLGSYEIPLLLGRENPQMVSVLTIRKLQRYDLLEKPEAYIIALLYCVLVLGAMVLTFKRMRSISGNR